MRPEGERSFSVVLPSASPASLGRSGTRTGCGLGVGVELIELHAVLAKYQNEGAVREGDGTQQRLDVEAVRHMHLIGNVIGEPVGQQAVGRGEERQAVGLGGPEGIVIDKVVDHLLDRPQPALVDARGLQLFQRLVLEVLERDTAGADLLRERRGLDVDRHRRLGPRRRPASRSRGATGYRRKA